MIKKLLLLILALMPVVMSASTGGSIQYYDSADGELIGIDTKNSLVAVQCTPPDKLVRFWLYEIKDTLDTGALLLRGLVQLDKDSKDTPWKILGVNTPDGKFLDFRSDTPHLSGELQIDVCRTHSRLMDKQLWAMFRSIQHWMNHPELYSPDSTAAYKADAMAVLEAYKEVTAENNSQDQLNSEIVARDYSPTRNSYKVWLLFIPIAMMIGILVMAFQTKWKQRDRRSLWIMALTECVAYGFFEYFLSITASCSWGSIFGGSLLVIILMIFDVVFFYAAHDYVVELRGSFPWRTALLFMFFSVFALWHLAVDVAHELCNLLSGEVFIVAWDDLFFKSAVMAVPVLITGYLYRRALVKAQAIRGRFLPIALITMFGGLVVILLFPVWTFRRKKRMLRERRNRA